MTSANVSLDNGIKKRCFKLFALSSCALTPATRWTKAAIRKRRGKRAAPGISGRCSRATAVENFLSARRRADSGDEQFCRGSNRLLNPELPARVLPRGEI